MPRHLSMDQKIDVFTRLMEDSSVRGCERTTGVKRDTILRLTLRLGKQCAKLSSKLMRNVRDSWIMADEMHTYAGKAKSPENVVYIFTCLGGESRMLINFEVGNRDLPTAEAFMRENFARLGGRVQLNSDSMGAYADAVERAFGSHNIDYGQAVKVFGSPLPPAPNAPNATFPAAAPAPAASTLPAGGKPRERKVVRMDRTVVFGKPLLKITTSAIESNNRTFRLHMRRLARQQCTHSRRVDALIASCHLFSCYYNLVRLHSTLRCTPAMEGKITDHIWEIGELIEEAEAA